MTLVVDAPSDEVQPEVVEEVVGVESNLKVRPRRRQKVARAGKKPPPPPPTHSSPPTPAPVQQLPEVVNQELQEPKEPKNSPQELEKVRLTRGLSSFTHLLSSLISSLSHWQR